MRLASIAVVLLAALAGCSDGGGAGDAPEATSTASGTGTAGPGPGNLTERGLPDPVPELTGCLQVHSFFPYPIAVFEQLGFELPAGFTFASDDGVTVNAFLAWWFCDGGRLANTPNAPFEGASSMFASLPVVPPADLAARDNGTVPVQLDLVPLTWVLTQRLVSDHLAQTEGLRGGYVELGEVATNGFTNTPAVQGISAFAAASFGTFEIDAEAQVQPGENPAARYRMWLATEGQAVGWLDIVNGPGPTVGSGPCALRFVGDPDAGAPPATAGTAHLVRDTNVTLVHRPLAAQA